MCRKILVFSIMYMIASDAFACKADKEHNQKYHGDPLCSQCDCLHYKRDDDFHAIIHDFNQIVDKNRDYYNNDDALRNKYSTINTHILPIKEGDNQ